MFFHTEDRDVLIQIQKTIKIIENQIYMIKSEIAQNQEQIQFIKSEIILLRQTIDNAKAKKK